MKNLLHILIILSLVTFASSVTKAQSASPEAEIIPANATSCQRNTINIANLKQGARIKNERIFVIAHLGSGEVSQNLNRRRLRDIGVEFDQIGPMDRRTLILAEGDRVKGQPRVDVYLGSKLYFVSYIPWNGDFCSLCCDRRREFYKNRYASTQTFDVFFLHNGVAFANERSKIILRTKNHETNYADH